MSMVKVAPTGVSVLDSFLPLDTDSLPMQAGLGGLALDSSGNLYLSADFAGQILKVSPTGVQSPFLNGVVPFGVAWHNGLLYFTVNSRLHIGAANPEPAPGLRSADSNGKINFLAPGENFQGLTVDAGGNVFIAAGASVQELKPDGTVIAVAGGGQSGVGGDGGVATSAQLSNALDVAIDSTGGLYISDSGRIRKVVGGKIGTAVGMVDQTRQPKAAPLSHPHVMAVFPGGDIYTCRRS